MLTQKIPLRTCLLCRKIKPQSELIALTRAQNGIVVDRAPRKYFGRSVYFCLTKCTNKIDNKRIHYIINKSFQVKYSLEEVDALVKSLAIV